MFGVVDVEDDDREEERQWLNLNQMSPWAMFVKFVTTTVILTADDVIV